jgi:signal transduction histidine kinase
VFRVVQESLTDIHPHAKTKTATLRNSALKHAFVKISSENPTPGITGCSQGFVGLGELASWRESSRTSFSGG